MTSIDFLRPRLVGKRFDGGIIPLEVLADLAILGDLFTEVAKWRFLQANPTRTRSPRGFADGVSFVLTDVQDGSAIPVIKLVLASSMLFATESQTYMEQARESVIAAIDAAGHKHPVTEHLPERLLGFFDRLGRNLNEGEAIEFKSPKSNVTARLNKDTRRALLLASSAVTELTDTTSIRGAIPEADQADETFELQVDDGRKIKAPLTTQHREAILAAFNGYTSGQRVLIDGIGRFNRQNRLIGFESIEQVTALDRLDIGGRLDELRGLQPGWLEGHGVPPSAAGLTWLSESFGANFPEDVPSPHLYPTPEGGIRAEWSLDPFELSLDIDLATHMGSWHALNILNQSEDVLSFNLDDSNAWASLAIAIRKMAGGML
jgi:hypothetical protein